MTWILTGTGIGSGSGGRMLCAVGPRSYDDGMRGERRAVGEGLRVGGRPAVVIGDGERVVRLIFTHPPAPPWDRHIHPQKIRTLRFDVEPYKAPTGDAIPLTLDGSGVADVLQGQDGLGRVCGKVSFGPRRIREDPLSPYSE